MNKETTNTVGKRIGVGAQNKGTVFNLYMAQVNN